MPGKKSVHTAKWDRCVKKVKEKSPDVDPYAICSSSIQDGGVKKEHQRRKKKDYYANKKKSKKNEMIIYFDEYVNENYQQQEEEQYWYKVKELADAYIDYLDGSEINISEFTIKNWLNDIGEPDFFAEPVYDEIKKS